MPAPRAVLADIHEFNLDHKVAHSVIKASGRLAQRQTSVVEESTKAEQLEEKVEIEKVVPEAIAEQLEEAVKEEVAEEMLVEPEAEQTTDSTTDVESVLDVEKTSDVQDSTTKKIKRGKKDSV
jgi:hypothetical protein